MPKYLTVNQYLAADEAVPSIDVLTTTQLTTYIRRAERSIDTALLFDPRIGGFEPHAAWIQQPFDMDTRKTRIPNTPIPIRAVQRYSIQIANASTESGAGFFTDVSQADIALNTYGGYIEVLPLQAILYTLVPVFSPFGMEPPVVQVEYTVGYYFPVTSETLTTEDNQTYQAENGFWASAIDLAPSLMPTSFSYPTPTVYVNGAVQTTGFTLDTSEGTVKFAATRADSDIVTADYSYQIPPAVVEATIAQTSYLLALRELNQYGMNALGRLSSDGQSLSTNAYNSALHGLCPRARDLLSVYLDEYPLG